MRIALLGSVNPKDFGLEIPRTVRDTHFRFGRSMPVVDLAESLAMMGHEVLVVSLVSGLSKTTNLDSHRGIKLKFLPARRPEKLKAFTFYRRERIGLLKAIKEFGPNIVHAHWTYEYALAAQESNFPHLITVHDAPWEIFKDFRNVFFFIRYLIALKVRFRSSHQLVYVSRFILNKWVNQMFVAGGVIIPNMVSLDLPKMERTEIKNNILSVGNTNRGKNIKLLLDAWALLSEANPSLSLHIVGPGLGPTDSFARNFQNLEGIDKVIWHGQLERHELHALYRECNILVHPSLHESFGLVILEAFSHKLAVIALKQAGGTEEIIGDAGVLMDSSDPILLADSICELVSDSEKVRKLTLRGTQKLSEYSSSRITRQYIDLYEKTIIDYAK